MLNRNKVNRFAVCRMALALMLATVFGAAHAATASGSAAAVAQGFVTYATSGSSYTQNFDTLPFTNGTAVNTASPATIGGTGGQPTTATQFTVPGTANSSFSLSDVSLGAGNTAIASGMDGWYGFATVANKLGAHEGSQTTGGLVSFGGLTSSNRAVGLMATSSSGVTAFAVCIKNTSGAALNQISLSFTGEFWHQGATRALTCGYFIDTTNATPVFPTLASPTALPSLTYTVTAGTAAAVDGTQVANQSALSVTNQFIGTWGNNQHLWIVWQLNNANSGSQGYGIDNLTFSGSVQPHAAPVIASFAPNLTYVANAQTVNVAPTATVTSNAANFASGNLTIGFSAGGVATQDQLAIANVGTAAGQIGVSGANVTFGGATIGTFTGGTHPAALVVTLNSSATPAATSALLAAITYKNAGAPATLGTRTVSVTVDDGSGVIGSTSSASTLTISVASGPVAVNDSYTTTANTALTVPAATGVFANDNGNGQPLQIIVNSTPGHGSVTMNGADGSFVYTPTSGYTGTDTFTYTVSNAVQLWKTNLPPLGTFGGVKVTAGGYGSSLCPVPGTTNEYYGVTDRGPNIGGPGGIKIQPIPSFQPAIGRFKLMPDGTAQLQGSPIGMKLPNGTPYTGRANSTGNTGETITDLNGTVIPPDATGYDPEGLVALADGTFWVSDEYGPFITHFDATGKQIGRLSPYDASIPAELALRVPNKGMEGLCITSDGSMLVGMMQNALNQGDLTGSAAADATTVLMNRIVTYTFATGAVHEYMYLLEGKFGVSEITALSNTTFLVDERDGKYIPSSSKKLFTIDISSASDVGPTSTLINTSNFTYSANTTTGGGFLVGGASLEKLLSPNGTPLTKATATTALATAGLVPVTKTATPALDLIGLLTTLDSQGRFFSHDKVEGVALVPNSNGRKLILVNDSDFGITDSTSTVPPFALTQKVSPNNGAIDDGEFLLVNLDMLPTTPVTATVTITITPLTFTAVSSGDVTTSDVILWTRANQSVAANITAQVSPDFNFGNFVTFSGTTDPTQDNTVKINATSLTAGTKYYYRFVGPNGEFSMTGSFKTAPAVGAAVAVKFGFSGDCDGQYRPFPSTFNFAANNFDFFMFCGDTMYENAVSPGPIGTSAIVPNPENNAAGALAGLRRKYLENILPVSGAATQFPALQSFFASQANYTLLDNHELCSNIGAGAAKGAFQCGGATTTAGGLNYLPATVANDANTGPNFANKTAEFQACVQAYRNYEPIREVLLTDAGDPRTVNTYKLYNAQQWGKNVLFINTDDRSYADQRTSTQGSPRADNPARTRLGATQLAWLKAQLLAAQNAGVTWKFVTVSDPIDQIGKLDGTSLAGTLTGLTIADGSKSWMGGYRFERNDILKFIADNKILNVVFLATDDHTNRVNELMYSPDPSQIANQAAYLPVPACFTIVGGPIGASGPDVFTTHTPSTFQPMAANYASAQKALGLNPCGLDPAYPGLHDVTREGDPTANTSRSTFDFFSVDTFNYVTFDISANGKTLTVNTIGINSYAANTFPAYDAVNNPLRTILSFQVDAYVNPVSIATTPATGGAGSPIALSVATTLAAATIQPTVSILASTLPAGATLNVGTLNNGVYTLTSAQLAGLSITVPTTGSYTLNFTANTLDMGGFVTGTAKTTLALTVTANAAPIAQNGSVVVTGINATTGTLVATDAEKDALTFSIVTNGTNGTATITNVATGAFSYTAKSNNFASDSFTFVAKDATNTSNTATITVGVVQQVLPPTAVIAPISTGILVAPASMTFDGSASAPGITTYAWDFGDGSKGTGAMPSHTYTSSGTFTVSLAVTNGAGTSAPATVTVNINKARFAGNFNRSGITICRYEVTLPDSIPIGTKAVLTIGKFTVTFLKFADGKTTSTAGCGLHVSGKTLTFHIRTDASKLFGTPLPSAGTKTIPINYNGSILPQTITFSYVKPTTTFQ